MEITAIAFFVGAVMYGLGVFCGKSSPCSHEYSDYLTLARVSDWEMKLGHLEAENRRLDRLYSDVTRNERTFHEYMAAHCSNCNKIFYAQTPKEQKIADLLKTLDTSKAVEELAKKLDIKIR